MGKDPIVFNAKGEWMGGLHVVEGVYLKLHYLR